MRAEMVERIRQLAERQKDLMVAVRRDIHANPELAFQEVRTSRLMADQLGQIGLAVRSGVGKTGALALLNGKKPGKTVALRADIDALPFDEQTGAPYASRVPGAAHLCGHDAHAAMLLGAAHILAELQEELPGNVKFLVEPAEEAANAEGMPGAQLMVADGALVEPQVDAIFAAHVFPEYPTGVVALRAGSIMAGHSRFDISIIGRGSHAATPHLGVDGIAAAAQVISALQSLGNRLVPPGDAFALNIGTIRGGEAYNLLAGRVDMVGSVRTGDEALRSRLGEIIEGVVRGVTAAAGASYEFRFEPNTFPATVNDPAMAALVRRSAADVVGEEAVVWMDRPRLTGETFCHYLWQVPGAYFILGTGNEQKGTTFPSHHPRFNIDEDVLPLGATLLATVALEFLEQA